MRGGPTGGPRGGRAGDSVIKGYDPIIMGRILRYLKPYWVIATAAVLALFLATAGELALPVLLQRTIDQFIIGERYAVEADKLPAEWRRKLKINDSTPVVDGRYIVTSAAMSATAGPERDTLIKSGVLDEQTYYLFSVDGLENRARTAGLSVDHGLALVPTRDAGGMPPELRDALRSYRFAGITRSTTFYGFLLLVVLVSTFAQIVWMARAGQRVMKDIRGKLMDHVLNQALSFLQTRPVGTLVSRVTSDVETINELFTSVATSLLKDVSLMAGVIVTMFLLNARLASIVVMTMPPVVFAAWFFRTKARDAYRRMRRWVSEVNAYLSEHISGMAIVQLFSQEHRTTDEFGVRNTELMKASLAEMMVYATFRPLINLLTTVSIGTLLYFGAGLHLNAAVSLGVLIAFLSLVESFYRPVMDLSEKFTILQSAMAGGERVFELLDGDERIEDAGEESMPADFNPGIRFEDVNFSYVEGERVIRNLDFEVRPGETLAIVGYTGAGKTTIANLLTRLWDVDSGSISLDGTDIRDFPLAELRRLIEPVQQDVFIFSGTVAENIALGSGIDRETVVAAAKSVQAHEFIEAMPDGYDTRLTEGGTNISTGQRQLLSFARVIAHDPRILILDEATASIDTETEKKIQAALLVLFEGRTSLVIAHRLSTIRDADRILVMSAGRVAEVGSHDELLAADGIYAKLYRLQFDLEVTA